VEEETVVDNRPIRTFRRCGSPQNLGRAMPTLITELTPLQRMWLYENQLTGGDADSRDACEDRWSRMGSTYSTDIFRDRPEPPPPHPRMRKRKYEQEFCISPRLCEDDAPPRHQAHGKGPKFPFRGEKLTWQQSLDNLKVYRDHYGVSEHGYYRMCNELELPTVRFSTYTVL
jgi:hypothetical protein